MLLRYILIDSHVPRNSDSRLEILKKDEIIFGHRMLYQTNATSLQPNWFPVQSFSATTLKHKGCVLTLTLTLHKLSDLPLLTYGLDTGPNQLFSLGGWWKSGVGVDWLPFELCLFQGKAQGSSLVILCFHTPLGCSVLGWPWCFYFSGYIV